MWAGRSISGVPRGVRKRWVFAVRVLFEEQRGQFVGLTVVVDTPRREVEVVVLVPLAVVSARF